MTGRASGMGALLLARLVAGPPPAAPSLHAQTPPDSAAIVLVREDPDSARRAIDALLALASRAPARDSAERLVDSAARLSGAFAATWHDSIPARTVAWFRAADPERRSAKVRVDSIRLAGNRAFTTGGLTAALGLWRSSLSQATALSDTAGMVAALANIGTGFYRAGAGDSAKAYLDPAYGRAMLFRDYRGAGTAVGALGSLRKDGGEYRSALDLYREAAALHERAGDTRGLAADLNNMGLVAAAVGDTARARRSYERALELNRRYARPSAAAANLVNLGNLADLHGDFPSASSSYREALAIYQRDGDRSNIALVLQNLGRLHLRWGRYPEAARQLDRALTTYRETGPAAAAVSTSIDLARSLAAMGKPQQALDRLDQTPAATEQDQASLSLARAEMLARLNRVTQADRQLVRAERVLRASGEPSAQADVREERALLKLRSHRAQEARDELRLALAAREVSGDVRAIAATRLLLGFASENLDDTTVARAQYEQSRAAFGRIGDRVGEAVAFGALGQLAASQGLGLTAESLYTAGLRRLGSRPAGSVAWWLHFGLGASLADRRELTAAAGEMRAAVDAVESSSGTFAMPELRAAFMADKWQPYLELARLENALGRHDEAFAVSERLRAQELLELLSRARVVTATDSAGLAEEQELRQRVSDLTYRLAGAEPELAMYRGPALVGRDQAEVREALAVAEERYASVLEHQRAGAASSGSARALVSAASVSGTLKPDEVFVEYLLSDSTGTAFVVTADTLAAFDLGVGRKTLANLIDFARGTITADSGPQSTLWRAPLRRLYQYLIQPIDRAGLLAGKHRLILAPHAELHYLPFATLIAPGRGEQFLVQRYAITYTPSASVWSRLAGRDSASAPRGLLALAPVGGEALPGAEAEVRGMGRLFPGAAVRLGPEASESAFKRVASSYQFLHIATLGVLNKQNPLFSYVALRPGGEEDGRLEVHEVLNLSLHSRLVVLSACQTGLGSGALGDVPPGDDWVGLVQAFLYAGSAKVLATAWPIVDRATDPLMRGFYRRLQAGVTEDMALAMEQRAAIADPRLRHPRFWGPFMLTGGR